jgi:hypothetical protein
MRTSSVTRPPVIGQQATLAALACEAPVLLLDTADTIADPSAPRPWGCSRSIWPT